MKRARLTEENVYGTALDRLTGIDRPVKTPATIVSGKQPRAAIIKLSVFLSQKEDAYLENLGSIAKFSGGKKISKTKLIETMIKAFSTTKLDVRGLKTDEELLERVIAQLR